MLKHRLSAPALLGGCLVMGVLFTADVLLSWDAAQRFALTAPASLRWGVWLALGAGAFALSRTAAVRPAALLQPHKPLGALMLLTGALLEVQALVCGGLLEGVLAVLAGAWLLRFGTRALAGPRKSPPPPAVTAVMGMGWFFWLLVYRALVVPAAAVRLSCTVRVFSAAAALLLMLLLAKVFLVPGLPCGHTLFAVGTLSFLFCTCMELPLTLVRLVTGPADLTELLTALPLAAAGLCGAVCAAACLGPDTVE